MSIQTSDGIETEVGPSIGEFAADVGHHLERLRREQQPIVLTHDGEPAVVVIDVALYRLLAESNRRDLDYSLRRQIEAVRSGEEKGVEAREFFRQMREEHGIPENT